MRRWSIRGGALVLALALILLVVSAAQAQGPQPPTLARLPFASQAELEKLVAAYDVWEVDYQAGNALVALSDVDVDALRKVGTPLVIDPKDKAAHTFAYPACYAGVDSLYAQLNQLATDYPALVTVEDFGASWLRLHPDTRGNGSRLLALVLGNRATTPRATFFLMANIHARELATPELALAFARQLLQGYGSDPDVTWQLDTQRTVVVVTVNPDGHRVAEQGYLQRKNANNTAGGVCATPPTVSSQTGVDLNRNHSYFWGGAGTSTSACSQTYRGTAPASEIETQAVQEYVAALFPTRRATATTTMPLDTPNLLISLHSYGEWVLWPWGYQRAPAPEETSLQALGARFAAFNGYVAGQSSTTLYDTSGDTTDWAYGQLGVAAYTFEVGTDFFQPCNTLQPILDDNLPALRYASRVAAAPYQQPLGPDIANLASSLGVVSAGTPVPVTLTASAPQGGTVAGVEVSVDNIGWTPGAGVPLSPVDGAFNGVTEAAQGTLTTVGLTPGRHLVYARARTNDGHWGPVWASWLTITNSATSQLSGRVLGAGDVPLVGARVVLAPGGATTTTGADGGFSLTVPAGLYTVGVSLSGYAPLQTTLTAPLTNTTLRLTPEPCILLVDADPAGVALASWMSALAGGPAYRVWRVADSGSPRLNTLREHGIVIWVGGENGALSEAQQSALQGYLEAGGHLLMSGQKLGLGQPPALKVLQPVLSATTPLGPFFTRDLHFTNPSPVAATSLAGADFLAGQSLVLGIGGVTYTQNPLALFPTLGGATVLRYGPGAQSAAVAYADGTRRLVVFGFGLETVGDVAQRQTLLHATVRWLGCPGDCALAADLNRDGRVDTLDIQLVAGSWLTTSADAAYVRHHDVDGSGRVDVVDLAQVTRAWGTICP